MSKDFENLTIVIAGASGFVGTQLVKTLAEKCKVIALSRSRNHDLSNVTWRSCDLFSLKQAEVALKGADVAIYLVHSMMPQARLTQGSFVDFDMIIADNFARACKSNGIRWIIYLAGIHYH